MTGLIKEINEPRIMDYCNCNHCKDYTNKFTLWLSRNQKILYFKCCRCEKFYKLKNELVKGQITK